MAESFETLGAGNGFSSCLQKIPAIQVLNRELLNPPSLEQTMQAYWNFDSATFGGASFNPDNQPKDLICNASANVGSNVDGDSRPGYPGEFFVRNSLPTIFFKDGVKYYKHGISMSFSATNDAALVGGGSSSSTFVIYSSSLYVVDQYLSPYSCVDETFGEPPDPEVIGKSASERTQTISSVTIGGIPFIKNVIKSFGGAAYNGPGTSCPTPNFPAEPSTPTLTLHTY